MDTGPIIFPLFLRPRSRVNRLRTREEREKSDASFSFLHPRDYPREVCFECWEMEGRWDELEEEETFERILGESVRGSSPAFKGELAGS